MRQHLVVGLIPSALSLTIWTLAAITAPFGTPPTAISAVVLITGIVASLTAVAWRYIP